MLYGFLVLLLCQLVGELFVHITQMPVPGPVVGMLILLVFLIYQKQTSGDIRIVSEGLLKYLALLYVPAGVGLILHLQVISEYWLAILVALVVSTFVTFLVVAGMLKLLSPEIKEGKDL